MKSSQKFAQVCFLGAPNAGKSTLLNTILQQKLAPVHRKPQMTRRNLLGVFTEDDIQLAFVDTPGLHESTKALNQDMLSELGSALDEADLFVVLLSVDQSVSDLILRQSQKIPKEKRIIVLNKCDLQPSTWKIHPEKIQEMYQQQPVLISAETGGGTQDLIECLKSKASDHPFLYDADHITTATTRNIVAEYIRESVMEYLHDEIPYEIFVEIESYRDEPNKARIMASIIVNQESQKGVVIGKAGSNLRRIRQRSESMIRKLIEKSVSLQIHVKVEKDWIKTPSRQKMGLY